MTNPTNSTTATKSAPATYFPLTTTVVGYVGEVRELRTINKKSDGESIAVFDFSVAINVGTADDRKTQWVRIEVWRKYATAMYPLVKKGMKVTVEVKQGKLEAYIAESGDARANLVMVADKIHLPSKPRTDALPDGAEVNAGDIPF